MAAPGPARTACPLCGFNLESGGYLAHIRGYHTGQQSFWLCRECGFTGRIFDETATHCFQLGHSARKIQSPEGRLLDILAQIQAALPANPAPPDPSSSFDDSETEKEADGVHVEECDEREWAMEREEEQEQDADSSHSSALSRPSSEIDPIRSNEDSQISQDTTQGQQNKQSRIDEREFPETAEKDPDSFHSSALSRPSSESDPVRSNEDSLISQNRTQLNKQSRKWQREETYCAVCDLAVVTIRGSSGRLSNFFHHVSDDHKSLWPQVFSCTDCGYSNESPFLMRQHLKVSRNLPTAKFNTVQSYISKEQLQEHIEERWETLLHCFPEVAKSYKIKNLIEHFTILPIVFSAVFSPAKSGQPPNEPVSESVDAGNDSGKDNNVRAKPKTSRKREAKNPKPRRAKTKILKIQKILRDS